MYVYISMHLHVCVQWYVCISVTVFQRVFFSSSGLSDCKVLSDNAGLLLPQDRGGGA